MGYLNLHLHRLGPKFKKKLERKRAASLVMLHHFTIVAREIIQYGGHVSFEWPRHCHGWQLPQLTSFIEKFSLQKVNFDGCSFGLRSKKGNLIKKPWTVATTSNKLVNLLFPRKCDRQHSRQTCEGNESKRSAYYTGSLADTIIDGLCYTKPLQKAPKDPQGPKGASHAHGQRQ